MDNENSQRVGAWPDPITLNCLSIYAPQLSNDPGLVSLPLLATFLKSFRGVFLNGTSVSNGVNNLNQAGDFPTPAQSALQHDLIESEIRDRFTKMCHGYFDKVSKKLVSEYNVSCICTGKFYLIAL